MFFTRISIDNPWLATMVMLALVVLGLFSYQRLQVDQFPDVTFPVVVVQTDYPGAAPESVEAEVTRKVEEAVNTVSGLRVLSSRSYSGTSLVVAEFELTVDPVQAAQDVREKVAAIRAGFRREIKEPKITRFDPADRPILSLAVTSAGGRSLRELTTLADQVIKKRLENVRGVGQVTLVGGVKREVQVYLKPAQLEALAIGVDQVVNAVRAENQELPLGALRSAEQERVVQIQARARSPEDFNRIVVARRPNSAAGQAVYLSQVATVVDGEQERESAALVDDRETLALDVLKAQGQNTIEVAQAVQRAAAAVQAELPADVRIEVVKDASVPIRTAVTNVTRTMVEGALLTILIVFLFLGSWRSTVITGLTLPIATIGTFLVMYVSGFTLNMLTLMAMSLCIGLLIDDAIVVRENIVRHGAMGKSHREAALVGTQEIGLAVLATTLSIVAVFLPVGFMGGIIGRFFHQFGITVVAAVLISMFVSFTLDPMLSSVWPDPAVHGARPRGPLGWVLARFERLTQWLGDVYHDLLEWSLRHRLATLAIAAATFGGGFLLVPLLGTEFVPQADFSETQVYFRTPEGTSLEATVAKARQVQAALREFPEVKYAYTTINTGAVQAKNAATVYVKLVPRQSRARNQAQLTQPLRERLARIAGIEVTHVGVMNPVAQQKLLVVSLQGTDLKQLERQSAEAMQQLARIPGLVDLDSSLRPARPTLDLAIDRDLAGDLGLGVERIGAALRPLLAGEAASSWRDANDESYDVTVRLAPAERTSTADLERLSLTASTTGADGAPRLVPLRQVVELRPGTGASQINRRDLTREVELTANVHGRSAGEVSADIRGTLEAMDWQPGYRFVMGGSTRDMAESFAYAASALALAVIFIYMILTSQFRSFLQPLAIMSSLPLTLIGVFLALLAFRSTLNIFSIIGFIMLMGLVTKNAILLVDFAQQARQGFEGAPPMDRTQALVTAARVRLRPILMTTLAMVFGMVPLALGLTEGSEQRAPMGQAVIGGIVTSSLLTLVVVPVIYTYLDDLARWARGARGGAAVREAAPAARRRD
jgi:HAE1 family hydrophobic/amphiphilic exporter-1